MIRSRCLALHGALSVVCFALGLPAKAAEGPRFVLPVACEPGRTCFVQNHVDLDPGAGVRDYACGEATYDGHKGVDFRLLSAAAATKGVAVIAAAAGTVKGVRDGVEDRLLRDGPADGIAGRECGNGVVLDHGGGWETQYCHLRKGSVTVARGERIEAGGRLGSVGYSGMADFAHLHFEVRRNGKTVDPFTGLSPGAACLRDSGGVPAGSLWDEAAQRVSSRPGAQFIEAGFAAAVPGTGELERGGSAVPAAGPVARGLVFFARLMHGRTDDTIRLVVTGPEGFAVSSASPLRNGKAVFVASAGKRLVAPRWPAGRYEGTAELVRQGNVVTKVSAAFDMP